MKRLLFKIFLFAVLCIVFDQGIGALMHHLGNIAKSGETYRNRYMFHEMKDSVLIFGSSRALHHYNPQVISAELGGSSCYNCGISGYGIILFYPRLMKILEHYTPRMIIYDAYSSFDLRPGDNHKYLRYVRQIEHCDAADDVMSSIDGNEKYKLLSHAYRYNSQLPQSIGDCVKKESNDLRGYEPKLGVKQKVTEEMTGNPSVRADWAYDDLKLQFMQKLMETCQAHHIQLVVTISPLAVYEDTNYYAPIRKMCENYGFPFLNYERLFMEEPEKFYDIAHMNAEGANKYSTILAQTIKGLIQ